MHTYTLDCFCNNIDGSVKTYALTYRRVLIWRTLGCKPSGLRYEARIQLNKFLQPTANWMFDVSPHWNRSVAALCCYARGRLDPLLPATCWRVAIQKESLCPKAFTLTSTDQLQGVVRRAFQPAPFLTQIITSELSGLRPVRWPASVESAIATG